MQAQAGGHVHKALPNQTEGGPGPSHLGTGENEGCGPRFARNDITPLKSARASVPPLQIISPSWRTIIACALVHSQSADPSRLKSVYFQTLAKFTL